MLIITRQTYRFTDKDKPDIFVKPSKEPQSVPDDLKTYPLFEMAAKDGSVTVVEIPGAPAPETAPDPEPDPAPDARPDPKPAKGK
ncbi:MAG TPA: hypothetical protein VN736_00420 [Candidatus Limnocylindrales bacterium]|nr:hypothetical protein [Candidatus Limnocylindrales bacterium]